MGNKSKLVLIGNLDSILFKQRISQIIKSANIVNYTVLDTSKKTFLKKITFIYKSIFLLVMASFFFKKINIIFHGAYNSVLWMMIFFPRVRIISILQGSEIEKDYYGFRSILIRLILKHSNLILCRSNAQKLKVIELVSVKTEVCEIVSWGISNNLLSITKNNNNNKYIKIISPRATQPEYNIEIIFKVIKKLKKEGYHIKFCYVEYNKTIDLLDQEVVDKKMNNSSQTDLWQEIANSDVCISIPEYDGFSNTIIESIALGTYNICSDLTAYQFFKKNSSIGVLSKLGVSNNEKFDNLYEKIKVSIIKIEKIRNDSSKRSAFAIKNFYKVEGLDKLIYLIRSI